MYANTQNTSSHDISKHLFSPYSMPESCLDFVYIYYFNLYLKTFLLEHSCFIILC